MPKDSQETFDLFRSYLSVPDSYLRLDPSEHNPSLLKLLKQVDRDYYSDAEKARKLKQVADKFNLTW